MKGACKKGEPRPLSSSWRSHPEESAYYKRDSRETLSRKAEKRTREERQVAENARQRVSAEQRQARWKELGWTS